MLLSPVELKHASRLVNHGPTVLIVTEHQGRRIELTESSSRMTYRALPDDDPRQRQPEITKVLAELDWQPRVDLQAGLARTIAYFREVRATLPRGGFRALTDALRVDAGSRRSARDRSLRFGPDAEKAFHVRRFQVLLPVRLGRLALDFE